MASELWYPTKVDTWLAVLVALGPLMTLIMLLVSVVTGTWDAALVTAGALVFLGLLLGGLVWPMRYGLVGDELIIHHGLMRQHIKLSDICEVSPTNNPLSSPALSLDRLLIRFGPKWTQRVMISPREQPGFLAELAQRAKLTRAGERLVRGDP